MSPHRFLLLGRYNCLVDALFLVFLFFEIEDDGVAPLHIIYLTGLEVQTVVLFCV